MSSYVSNLVHFVWSTAGRRQFIRESWQDQLYGYIGGIVRRKKASLLCAGGVPDHIHLFMSLSATASLAAIVNAVKTNSSKWIHENIPGMRLFAWQEKYGAFTVSKSNERQVIGYIKKQAEHHRKRPFEEEFLALLQRHGIEYDERYLWD
jgi:REP element-mobilizing transposase RayT